MAAAGHFDGNAGKKQQYPGPEPGESVNPVLPCAEEGEKNRPEAEESRDGHPRQQQKNGSDHHLFTKINLRIRFSLYLIIPVKSIRNPFPKGESRREGEKFIDKPAP